MLRSRSLFYSSVFASLALTAVLAGCSGSSSVPAPPPGSGAVPAPAASVAGLSYSQLVAVPAWKPGVSPSYDISWNNGKYNVLADRTSQGVNIVNDATQTLTQVTGAPFTGFSGKNDTSGPDGVVYDNNHDLFYVGDVNKVVIINANTATVAGVIAINGPGTATGTGKRTDEGCYDPVDHIMMMTNNADAPPFSTFINTDTNTVITQYVFPADSVGAEQCAWNPATSSFYVNNVGDDLHPGGALDQITAASVKAAAAAKVNVATLPEAAEFDETASNTGCNPAGLATGKDNNMLVGCGDVGAGANAFDPTADPTGYNKALQIYGPGKPLHSLIMNPAGQITVVVPYGGSDEVYYDSKKNRYYAAARNWTTSGLSGGTPFTSIGVIDAGSGSILGLLPTVGNVHSVAADPNTGNVYVPQHSTSSAQGGISVWAIH